MNKDSQDDSDDDDDDVDDDDGLRELLGLLNSNC